MSESGIEVPARWCPSSNSFFVPPNGITRVAVNNNDIFILVYAKYLINLYFIFSRLLGKQAHYDVALPSATNLTLLIDWFLQMDRKTIQALPNFCKFPHGCNRGPFLTLPEVVGDNSDQIQHLIILPHLPWPVLRVTPPLNIINLHNPSPPPPLHRPQLLDTLLHLAIDHSLIKIVWRPQYGTAPLLRSYPSMLINIDLVEVSPWTHLEHSQR